jgi:hypothetical protein
MDQPANVIPNDPDPPSTPPRKNIIPPFTPRPAMKTQMPSLIIRGIGANTRNSDPLKIVGDAINQIRNTNPDLATIPITINPFSPQHKTWQTSCYVNLTNTSRTSGTEPRTDLLQLWMNALALYDPKWELGWSPAKQGTDKRMNIRFPDINSDYGDQDNAKEKIVQWANEKGYLVLGAYKNKGGVIINLANPRHVDEIINRGTISIKGITFPLRAVRVRQIEIQNPFELVITGAPLTEYEGLDNLILTWLQDNFQNEGQPTVAGLRSPTNEPDIIVFHMTTWADTAKVLLPENQEKFLADFTKYDSTITAPTSLYEHNTKGVFKVPGNARTDIQKGANDVTNELQEIKKQMRAYERKNEERYLSTQLQLTSITSNLSTVTTTMASLEDRMVNTQRAILLQSKEIGLGKNLSDVKTNILTLQMRLLMEADPVARNEIKDLLSKMNDEKKTIEHSIEMGSRDFLTVLSPIGQLQQSTSPTATVVEVQEPQTPNAPLVPPGIQRTNLRRTSASVGQLAEDPTPIKKRRTEDEPTQQPMAEGDIEMVRMMKPNPPNMLIATYDDIPGSMKSNKMYSYRPKCTFRGVLDKLRDLSGYRLSRPPFCRSNTANESNPKSFLVIVLLLMTLSMLQTAQAVMPPPSTATLSIYALNANGLVQPVKMNHINKVIKASRPHVFVLGETKTKSKLNKSLPYTDYDIYEEPGECAENHHIFKWGIVVGIRKDLQVVQRLEIKQRSLRGRVIAIDLILPTADGRCLPHRLFGSYAPWNPGEEGDSKNFWKDMTQICRSTSISWTIAGDLNATIAQFERHSGGSEARRQYLHFLQTTNARDLWSDIPDRTRLNDWTCRSKREGHGGEGNIIDRVATSTLTLIDTEISVADRFDQWIPYTDHRGITARITHSINDPPREGISTHGFVRKASSQPRVKVPLKNEKHKYETFRETVDKLIEAKSLHDRNIVDEDSFIKQYNDLTEIITSTAKSVFGATKPFVEHKQDITNSQIKGILSKLKSLGGAICFEKSNQMIHVSLKAMKYHWNARRDCERNGENLLQFLTKNRRALYKSLYAERAKEIVFRAKQSDKRRIAAALRGSTKKMIQSSHFVPLPFALNNLDEPDKLVCDPEGVKATTREYFKRLYDHTRIPEMPKPWIETPSVVEVKTRVLNDKFQWPQKATLADFRAMIRRGNHRPSPGPDRWEKWTVKSLSDKALSLVLDLHNHEVLNSCFPGTIKDMWLTTIYKRGTQTDLKNWRGLSFNNFLANSPMTWLNQCLIRYAAEKRILPDTQVAAQPGVQTRDLMSYLASIKCWSHRHKETVFAIKRDQMKGFDYLSPEGFYDAIRAYGLPETIVDLDRAAQSEVRCFIQTAYGATSPITVSGVSKQGGPASPLKSTFTTSMGHYYLIDMLSNDKDALIVTSNSKKRKDPHLKDAGLELPIAMVEATDDTYIFSRTIESLQQNTLVMERFQYAYGWLTNWSKSNAYLITPEAGKQYPDNITFQSVSVGRGVDPLVETEHTISLIKDDLDFLRTKVDNPSARFNELKDFIEAFQFPKVIGRLPITLIRKIVAQNIISKCRALLALQPVRQGDAETLDKLIMHKVHDVLGFPFHPNTEIATLPVSNHGFGFPSIARINAGLAVEGLSRDLNHHIPAYRKMALITRADWICEKAGCINPIDGKGLEKDFTRQTKSIPSSWIEAQKIMRRLKLSLRETDQSYIAKGEVSLSHAVNVYNHKILAQNTNLRINGTTLRTITLKNIVSIKDFGTWTFNDDGRITLKANARVFNKSWSQAARRNWRDVSQLLNEHLQIDDLVSGPLDLAIPKPTQQLRVENIIRTMANACQFTPSKATDGNTWATDGSMMPANASVIEDKTITGAATGKRALVMRVPGRNVSILQGEQLGLILALVLSGNSSQIEAQQRRILTDHLNSVRLIEDSHTQISQVPRLRYMNG